MTVIPEKEFFRIGEVSDLAGIKTHVLRYWETEFPTLRPQKSSTNQRLYCKKDIDLVFFLKKLLYEEGYTIAGARAKLRLNHLNWQSILNEADAGSLDALNIEELRALLLAIREELKQIRSVFEPCQGNAPTHSSGNA